METGVGGGRERLLSLDVYRGLTIAGMILVTDPGTYSAVYAPLRHAEWAGGTLTDMIFPSFLFITGVALTLSISSRLARGESRRSLLLHVLRRCGLLIGLGLLLNAFPDFEFSSLRLPGILQRIGLCYLGASLVYLPLREGAAGRRRRGMVLAVWAASLLLVYWALLKLVPVPGFGPGRLDTLGSLPAYVDRAVFGPGHMWRYGTTPGVGVTFDPEGLLSTLAALAAVLVGAAAGEWVTSERSGSRKAAGLACAGVMLFALGFGLSAAMPPIKKIWTPTFGLMSSGFALVAFALMLYAVDVRRWRGWTPPALVFGTNAIAAFALSTVITTMLDRLHTGSGATLHRWGNGVFAGTGLPPVQTSLLYAALIVGVNLLLLLPLYRRRMLLRL